MIYLSTFHLPSRDEDESYFFTPGNAKNMRNIYTTKYPFMMFRDRGLPDDFEFSDITIICGNNGSGKSTILNVIAEKLNLKRNSPFNRSDFFEDYVELCDFTLDRMLSCNSCVITSDDVFDRVLDIRRVNNGIDSKREDLLREWLDSNSSDADANLHGLDDYERWKRVSDARNKNKTQSQFIRSRLMRNVQERSNGESSLALFVDSIADDALYLLDEPENSLSPANQLELKYFIEDCVRYHGCQFIISTHSPFLLSLKGAKIYDIDSNPVKVSKWTELDCVRVYKDFFTENEHKFID
ncbi:MAG: AAA family ATPase [Clostridia bacterium]|nr:AAA family ATPase [Clostridia bacterium]